MVNSDFCFFHDPKNRKDQQAARREGGLARLKPRKTVALPAKAADVKLETASDVSRLLSETISQVRRGEIDVRITNSVGYLANIILKAKEQADIENRLKELERVVLRDGKVTRIRTSALPA